MSLESASFPYVDIAASLVPIEQSQTDEQVKY